MQRDPSPLIHPDFCFDSPGTGPSTPRATPPLQVVPPDEGDNNNGAHGAAPTLGKNADWINGLRAKECYVQELWVELLEGRSNLAPGDCLIFDAFNFKVDTDITNHLFNKLRTTFPSCLGDLLSFSKICSCVAEKSGIQGSPIHCCVNSCVAYTSYYRNKTDCLRCGDPRYCTSTCNPDKQVPRRVFHYLPLGPRLQNLFFDPKTAETLSYRAKHQPDGNICDIFDGDHYRKLCGEWVTVGRETLDHTYHSQDTDIALGLATDGFGPFKSRKQTCWPLIIFNYNLPPAL
ncbi:hypothetical protein FRC09_015427 [Ceratobasidium sp. 395]|nr:hypothetical protein FRC09_015427 [Ceratobasidium sp. 395]